MSLFRLLPLISIYIFHVLVTLHINVVFVQGKHVRVAQDGTGDYWTIGAAVAAAPSFSKRRFSIHIKAGTYMENVRIGKEKINLVLIGDGVETTKIIASRHCPDFAMSETATLYVEGYGFIAKHITIENSAGPLNNQAVAVLNNANHSIFYRCTFLGYTDTLYAKYSMQFYRDCNIYGTRDFIFGNAAAVFQNCNLYARLPNNVIIFTAQGRPRPQRNTGFTIQNCTITLDPKLSSSYKTSIVGFLGRPWFRYSRVMVMESFLDSIVHPAGWMNWPGDMIDKLMYREFRNRGPGAVTATRVWWSGFKAVREANMAKPFTASKLIHGDAWIPKTGIPYYGSFASLYESA